MNFTYITVYLVSETQACVYRAMCMEERKNRKGRFGCQKEWTEKVSQFIYLIRDRAGLDQIERKVACCAGIF